MYGPEDTDDDGSVLPDTGVGSGVFRMLILGLGLAVTGLRLARR
ncbi:MAG: hypothetical protein ACR2FE_01175 [Aeromicrobium sp.]